MGLERYLNVGLESPDKFIDPIISTALTVRDLVTRVTASGAITMTLPAVADAAGKIFTIIARAASTTNIVTIADKDDSEGWVDQYLVFNGDKIILYSDGISWHIIKSSQLAAAGYDGVGAFQSATAGKGVPISSTKTKAIQNCADDAGVALTAGSYRCVEDRMLITAALSAGDISIGGNEGHVKVAADVDASTGIIYGSWGYCELAATGSINVACGVQAMIDVPTGAVIQTVAAGILIKSNDLGGTHTGKAAAIYTPNPSAGTWDFLLKTDTSTGFAAYSAAHYTPGNCDGKLTIDIGGHTLYVPAYDAIT